MPYFIRENTDGSFTRYFEVDIDRKLSNARVLVDKAISGKFRFDYGNLQLDAFDFNGITVNRKQYEVLTSNRSNDSRLQSVLKSTDKYKLFRNAFNRLKSALDLLVKHGMVTTYSLRSNGQIKVEYFTRHISDIDNIPEVAEVMPRHAAIEMSSPSPSNHFKIKQWYEYFKMPKFHIKQVVGIWPKPEYYKAIRDTKQRNQWKQQIKIHFEYMRELRDEKQQDKLDSMVTDRTKPDFSELY